MRRPNGIPTLGYPSRTAAVRAMLARGDEPGDIRRRLGLTAKATRDTISQARAIGGGRYQVKVRLSPVQAERLARAAAAHDVSRCRMAGLILRRALAHDLVAAILKDGGTRDGR